MAPDQLVDVFYDDECVFDSVRGDQAEWFSTRRALIMWRAHGMSAAGTSATR